MKQEVETFIRQPQPARLAKLECQGRKRFSAPTSLSAAHVLALNTDAEHFCAVACSSAHHSLTKEQAVRRKALIATIKLIRCIIRDLAILLLREVGQSQSLITFVSSSTLPTTGRSSYFSPLSYSACKMISSASNNWASIQGGGKKTGILQSGCSVFPPPPLPFSSLKKTTPI